MPGALIDVSLRWLVEQARAAPRGRPLVAGLCAPQGSGKTTLARGLVGLLGERGARAVALSIDDFYLPRERQIQLAAQHPGNRILEHRGAPGTHDVPLGQVTLAALDSLGPGETARLPAYDKTAHAGRGDRAPRVAWPEITGRVDVVLLEGWCLAFRPVPESELRDGALRPVNAALPAYAPWLDRIDALMTWRARSLESIVAWRVEAEERTRLAGRPALDRAAAEDYVRRFLPVYETYQDTATHPGPWGDRRLAFVLDADRSAAPA